MHENHFHQGKTKLSVSIKIFRVILFYFILFFTINLLANIFIYKSSVKDSLFVSPLAKDIIRNTFTFINFRENSKNLEKIVSNVLKEEAGDYGVVIFNLESGERYYLNEEKEFDTASLYKLWIMATAYNQIQNGKLGKSEILTEDAKELNKEFNISTDSADLTDGVISWPVRNALENMITISDNYSALLLTKRIKISNVSEFLKENNLNSSKVGSLNSNPKSTAKDIAVFYQKLYWGNLANPEYTQEMITLLKIQQINTKLSNMLPKDVVIAHKTGELDTFSHDAGIVYAPKGDYIIAVMSNTEDVPTANEKIAEISKGVYNYFTK